MNSYESGGIDPREQAANWKAPEGNAEQSMEQSGDKFAAGLEAKVLELGAEWTGSVRTPTGDTVYPTAVNAENSQALDGYLRENGFRIVEESDETIRFPSVNEARKSLIEKNPYDPTSKDKYFYRIGEKKVQ